MRRKRKTHQMLPAGLGADESHPGLSGIPFPSSVSVISVHFGHFRFRFRFRLRKKLFRFRFRSVTLGNLPFPFPWKPNSQFRSALVGTYAN